MRIFYQCDRCTACCRWPGQVRLSEVEITRLADFLSLSEREFINRFTRLNANRSGLALQEKANGDCIFLEGNDCQVNAVKPRQCREFPNVWNFPGFEAVCRAKAVLMEETEYRLALQGATSGSGG